MGIFRAVARLIALAVAVGAANAHAQTGPTTELSWTAPSPCPGETTVRSDLERMLGQPLAERRDQKLRVEGTVREDSASRFVVTLRVASARGSQRRELSNTDCQKLTEAAVLVIALAIDPTLVPPASSTDAAPGEPEVAPGAAAAGAATATPKEPAKPETPAPPAPAPSSPVPPASSPPLVDGSQRDDGVVSPSQGPESKPWGLSATAVGLASAGPLPGVAFGAGARVSAGKGRFRIAVHGAYFFPKVEPVPGATSSGVELALARVGVGLCGVALLGNPTLTACVGPVFGDMMGSGEGVENSSTEHDRWSAALAELTLTHVTSFGLTTVVGIEGGPAIDTPRFGVTENGEPVEVYRASGWVLGGLLGVGFRTSVPVQETNESAPPGKPTGVELRTTEAEEPSAALLQTSTEAEALYREHHAFVWRNARRLGCGDDWVDDAVHEVFLVAARRHSAFEGRSSARTWLFAITLRVVRRMQRDRARYATKVAAYELESEALSESPETRSETARYLRSLLARLDEPRRIVVILVELEGMTSLEVSLASGSKQGTVESRLRSARLMLQKMIERDRQRFERQMR